ncbi:fimbrial protein [Lelliottia nimipressuralis]|uniref:Fimbrial protein n=1 Tax=Lelliottia nimipressuralis TaxID=69220 RepID=A0ABD4KHV8_9ENTR|nr:fimbrial protein [Lelliottia nimipressuralis]MBF4180643.1 fimbrial protein [Lelliottia nimipressuralis]
MKLMLSYKPKNYLVIIAKIYFTICLLFIHCTSYAKVKECRWPEGTQNIGVNFGQLTLPPALPVGSVIATKSVSGLDVIKTTPGSYHIYYKYTSYGQQTSYNAMTTNLNGIGYRISMSQLSNAYWPYTYNGSCNALIECNGTAPSAAIRQVVELIKTSDDVNSGDLSGGVIGTVQCDNGETATNYNFVSTSIVSPSCTVLNENINVPLGNHRSSEFGGVGSTLNWNDFDVNLSCESQVQVAMRIDGISDPDGGGQGVLQIDHSSNNATGVGIQIWYRNKPNNAVIFGQNQDYGTLAAGNQKVMLSARYYQTKDDITAGDANGTVTFTMSYK